jgi:hypothetical protein
VSLPLAALPLCILVNLMGTLFCPTSSHLLSPTARTR